MLMISERAPYPELFISNLQNYAALLRKTGRSAEAADMEARAKAIQARHTMENSVQ